MSDLTIMLCGCHGDIFSEEDDGVCPQCRDEWIQIDEDHERHPDYDPDANE